MSISLRFVHLKKADLLVAQTKTPRIEGKGNNYFISYYRVKHTPEVSS